MLTTSGGLLDGRLRYDQPAAGFRSALEPVLLAASVPARAGDRVLEAGTGAGAALLCLHARVCAVTSVGVELDPAMAALANANARANGFSGMRIVTGDILCADVAGPFEHAIANPPYHPPGTASPLAALERAKRGDGGLITAWITRLARLLRPRGTMTLVLPSGQVPACVAAMQAAHCPCTALFPLWPAPGRPAKLVLVRGVSGARTPMQLAPGLVLHEPGGGFTEAAQRVLRQGAALTMV